MSFPCNIRALQNTGHNPHFPHPEKKLLTEALEILTYPRELNPNRHSTRRTAMMIPELKMQVPAASASVSVQTLKRPSRAAAADAKGLHAGFLGGLS